jgi:hypothetical protein
MTGKHDVLQVFKAYNLTETEINVMFEPWASTLTLAHNDLLEIYCEYNFSKEEPPIIDLCIVQDGWIIELNAWKGLSFEVRLNSETLTHMVY